MTNDRIAAVIAQVKDYVPQKAIIELQGMLAAAPDEAAMAISGIKLKSSTTTLVLSIFLGYLGIDRFYVGDIGLGVLKLLTAGLMGLWGFIDIFLCYKKAKKNNYKAIVETLSMF